MLPILWAQLDPISPNAAPLFMPANALRTQLGLGGYVIRNPGILLLERSKQGTQHRLALEI
jgi:hypothetical protein